MVMNAAALSAIAEKRTVIYNRNGTLITAKKGWVQMEYKGAVVRLRKPAAEAALRRKVPHSTPESRLYSEWIKTTTAGRQWTARRHLEAMAEVGRRQGWIEAVTEYDRILAENDPTKIEKFVLDWEAERGPEGIQEYYSSSMEDLMEMGSMEAYLEAREEAWRSGYSDLNEYLRTHRR